MLNLSTFLAAWARVRNSAGVLGHSAFNELEAEAAKLGSTLLARLEAVEKASGITPPAPIAGESLTERAGADAAAAITGIADPATLRKVLTEMLGQLFPDAPAPAKPAA